MLKEVYLRKNEVDYVQEFLQTPLDLSRSR